MSYNPFDEINDLAKNQTIESDSEENKNICFGEKHISITNDYYDIKLSKSFELIKLYHANRNIDSERTKAMVLKYKTKPTNFPPLIIAHIVDASYQKDEYVLIDGQHRYFCMKQLFIETNIDTIFTYKLYECKSVEELEELFADINCNIKFDNMFPYKKTGRLVDKIESYFKNSVSRAKSNRDYKFNPDKLKMKLVDMKFFDTYYYSVDEIFSKIIELNEKTMNKYYKLKLEKKLPRYDLNFLESIEKNKTNTMYLLFEREHEFEWLDYLVKIL
jgi:hypothetical protein